MSRSLGGGLLLAAGGMGWLLFGDRTSPMALELVELTGNSGQTVVGLTALVGVVLLVWPLLQPAPAPATSRPRPQPRPRQATPPPLASVARVRPDDPDWRSTLRTQAAGLSLEAGARLEINFELATPIILFLEQAPPERAKRTIAVLGSFIAGVPTPPRFKVVFDHCPGGGAPRHHQVSGALAASIPRSAFRVVSHVDDVDVIFLQPDPAWSTA